MRRCARWCGRWWIMWQRWAQARQVAQAIVPRIVIEMGGGQDDPGVADLGRFDEVGPARPAAAVAPGAARGIEPAPIGQTADCCTMRPAAVLADAGGALEAETPADVRPILRIEPAHLGLDRHCHPRLLAEHAIDAEPRRKEPAANQA